MRIRRLLYILLLSRLSSEHLWPGSGRVQPAEGQQPAHSVRHGRLGKVRQLHMREDRPYGEYRNKVRPLSLPLRYRVQPHRRCNPICHVVKDRQKSEVQTMFYDIL